MLIKTFAFSLLALAAGVTAAQAQTAALDNLSSTSGNTIKGASINTTVAEAFITGGSAVVLDSVMFPQILQGPAPSTYYNNYSSAETFSLYSTNPANGLPLAALVSLSVTPGGGSNTTASALSAGFGQTIAIVPSDTLSQAAATLLPNTEYWLVLSSPTSVSWDYTTSTTSVNYGSGFSLPATGAVSEVGATTYTLAGGPQQIIVNVVPEPSTYCLMAVAGLALVVSRKRTRKLA